MRTAIWIIVGALAAIYVAAAFLTVDHQTDQAQIDALIAQGVTATQKHDLSGLVSCVSRNYKDDSGLNYDQLRVALAQAMRGETNYVIQASNQSTKISGDKATVTMHVALRRGGEPFYDRDLTILLAKEDARHMLVVPVKAWRVVSSRNLGFEGAAGI